MPRKVKEEVMQVDAEEPPVDPEVEDALGALVQSSPERFPMGLGTIAERMGDVRYGAAVEGDEVTPAERERLLRALADAPLLEGRLISRDRTLTVVALLLDERVEDHLVMQDTVEHIDEWLEAGWLCCESAVFVEALSRTDDVFEALVAALAALAKTLNIAERLGDPEEGVYVLPPRLAVLRRRLEEGRG